MSPEQALGEDVDHRSDLFSLGILLYELLAGSQPFTGNTPISIADKIIHHQPPPITEFQTGIPAELERIIGRLLEKDREQRPQTADDLRADLKRLEREMDSAEVVASKWGATARPRLLRNRSRFLLASGLIAMLAVAAFVVRHYFNPAPVGSAINWNEARLTALTDMLGRENNLCISPDGQWELFRQRIGDSNAINLTNHPAADGRRMAYTSHRESANIFRVAFDAERGVVVGDPFQITFTGRRFLNLSLSPDGQEVAYYSYGDPQFDLFVSRVDGSETRQVTNDPERDWAPRFSPDGKLIAFFSNLSGKYEIWTINPDGGDRRQLTFSAPDEPGFVQPGCSPDGTRLFLSLRHGNSFIMDVTRPWQEQTLFAFPATPDAGGKKSWFYAYNWSPDGRRIIGSIRSDGGRPQGLIVYDLASRQYEQIAKEGEVGFWLNDNRRLVYNTNQGIYLIDTETRKTKLLHSIANLSLEDPTLSPDNKWLFYAASSLEEDIWMISLK
jgi:Tol biopolymer transport system component